ncbi:unnamed protein product [Hydatigera taeniaeformis]|uniref:P53 domain-containing protein n=1 Tax=Hydatigena taeniaeformis TaxID=6205 RepID=A0A0R3X5W2_HYDTA|nr:unnamed protein product [Hydatigera taeniaeformis]
MPPNLPCSLSQRRPFRGQYDFRLDFDGKGSAKDYKFYADETGRRVIFVNRDRPFVMRALFRLPLTPLNLYIRVVPLYIAHARRNEVVCRWLITSCYRAHLSSSFPPLAPPKLMDRCANHVHQLGTPTSGASKSASEMEAADALRSFITVQSPLARYCRLQGHLTILIPIDRQEMALGLRPPPEHRANRCHREVKQSEREGGRLGSGVSVQISTSPSHSQLVSQSPSSYPMGVAAESIVCRIGCYTSCLGGQARGAVELVVRLEEMSSDPLQPPSVLGLDCVEVHCSSTPARDIRMYTENATSSTHFKPSTIIRGSSAGNRSSGSRRHGRRGLSEPSISTRTKQRLTQVGANARTTTDFGSSGREGAANSSEVVPPSLSPSDASSISNSAFIDVPIGGSSGGPRQRFYLVATKSKERAAQLRLIDDAFAAFDGVQMSSSKFMAYREDCLMAQCIA